MTGHNRGTGVELRCSRGREDSLLYHEFRRGSHWLGAELVARTEQDYVMVEDAPLGEQVYLARTRHRNGLYSSKPSAIAVNGQAPVEFPTSLVSLADISPSLTGTAVDVELAADGSVVLSDGKNHGTYETPALVAAEAGIYFWSTRWSGWEEMFATFEDYGGLGLDSGEAHWWSWEGREATPEQPGADFDFTFEAAEDPTSPYFGIRFETPGWTWHGRAGAAGQHTRVKPEMSFDPTGAGSWSSWEPLRNTARSARKMKVRFTLDRESVDLWQAHLDPDLILHCLDSLASDLGSDLMAAHIAHADPHIVYQREIEKGAANGYANLDSGALVPFDQLGTGTATGLKFLRDDRTWQRPLLPGAMVEEAKLFGLASAVGDSLKYASENHSHGTPDDPIPAHVAEPDPHPPYQTRSEKDGSLGYAGLDIDERVIRPVLALFDGSATDLNIDSIVDGEVLARSGATIVSRSPNDTSFVLASRVFGGA